MRKLRVFESISLDGYYTDAQGGMEWAHRPEAEADRDFANWVGNNASGGGALVFGRVTYDMMASWWPSKQAAEALPVVAKGMNAAVKYVASRDQAFQPSWRNCHHLEGDAIAALRALKKDTGPDLTVLGSGNLAAQLGAAKLVDSYQFVIVPVALGKGRTVFSNHQPLTLVDSRKFMCGNVVVTYQVG